MHSHTYIYTYSLFFLCIPNAERMGNSTSKAKKTAPVAKEAPQQKGLYYQDINCEFFRDALEKRGLKVDTWRPLSPTAVNGTSVKAALDATDKVVGCHAFSLTCSPEDQRKNSETVLNVMLKSKGSPKELIGKLMFLSKKLDVEYGEIAARAVSEGLLKDHCIREICIAEEAMQNPTFQSVMPEVFAVGKEPSNEVMYFISEYFDDESFVNLDAVEGGKDHTAWDEATIKCVLRDISHFHAQYLSNLDSLPDNLTKVLQDGVAVTENDCKTGYCSANISLFEKLCPDFWTPDIVQLARNIIQQLPEICQEFNKYPKTLNHGDFNTRNVCLKRREPHDYRTCAYDWELSCIHVPQRDAVEFLSFALPSGTAMTTFEEYLEFYRNELESALKETEREEDLEYLISVVTDKRSFFKIADFVMMEMFITRVSKYFLLYAGMKKLMPFLPRVMSNATGYLAGARSRHTFL